MKRLLLLLTALTLSFTLLFVVGCDDTQPTVCQDGEHDVELTLALDAEDELLRVFRTGVCKKCSTTVKEFAGYGAISAKSASTAINQNAKDGDVVYLAQGTYSSIINVHTENAVTITVLKGHSVTARGFNIQTDASIFIDGINFEANYAGSGIIFAGNNKDVTIKNCNFKGGAYITNATHAPEVKNLVVENCTFLNYKNIDNDANIACGIYLTSPNGLTVRNCSFQTAEGARGAIYCGEGGTTKGAILIEGCTFKNSGTRVIRFYDTEKDCVLAFVGNKVYEHANYITVKDNANSARDNHGGAVIGVNSWEYIPDASTVKDVDSGFTVQYNEAEQLEIA